MTTFTETYRAADAQLRTLGAQAYNLALIPRRGGQTEFRPHVTSRQILNNIKYLTAKNQNFFDVIITPLHTYFFYLLVDDIRDYGAVLELGPIYAQETSAGSRQAVIMLPGDAAAKGGPDWDAARLLVSELNRDLGDPAVASPQQPMRLAGFRNMKPNRNGELVTALLLEPHAHASQAILDRWAELRQQRQPQRPYAAGSTTRPTQLPELPRREPAGPAVTAAFQEALQRHRAETADRSAADYRAICELIRAGYDPDALKGELEAVSERKHSPREYATRTVDRVVQRYIEYTTK